MIRFAPSLAALTVLASAAVPPALASDGPIARASQTKSVAIEDIDFKPGTVSIKRGGSVKWTWKDGPYTPHNVRSRGSKHFKGSSTKKTGTYTVRFSKAGTYRYVCTIHPGMRGKVVVR